MKESSIHISPFRTKQRARLWRHLPPADHQGAEPSTVTLGCSAQRLPTPGPEMAPAGAKEPPAEASSGASGRAQKHRSEEAGLGSPSVGTGHTLRDGHNPGSGGEQAGNSAPQTDVSFEEAGRCVGCSGPAGPLLGRDSTATLSWGHSQTHPTSPWGSRPQEEEGTEL